MPSNQSSEGWATLKENKHRSITALYMDENKTLQEVMQATRAENQLSSTQKIIEDDIEDLSRRRNANYNRFLKTPQYIDWLDASKLSDRNGILWIIGKPGGTKSTLLHFLLQTCRTKKEGIILSFKFDRYGDGELEMSAECFYRSLISQLLEARPGFQDILDAIRAEQPWDFRSLRSLLGLAIRLLGKTLLICFIDALDECKEAEIWEALGFLQQTCKQAASAGTVVRVCVASRPRLLD
ncbi:hypothetical protein EV127DRAFT_163864 [Xylaria flabelliformis]|nr:hypothetical protein EV127DRAFT_163864 [Xylaria flabelliformis]